MEGGLLCIFKCLLVPGLAAWLFISAEIWPQTLPHLNGRNVVNVLNTWLYISDFQLRSQPVIEKAEATGSLLGMPNGNQGHNLTAAVLTGISEGFIINKNVSLNQPVKSCPNWCQHWPSFWRMVTFAPHGPPQTYYPDKLQFLLHICLPICIEIVGHHRSKLGMAVV